MGEDTVLFLYQTSDTNRFPMHSSIMYLLLLFIGIYSVGQAAVHPPALVVLSHIVPNSGESIAWVGKGVVYDSGGLSIKSKVSRI